MKKTKTNSFPKQSADYYAQIINQKRIDKYNNFMVKVNALPYVLPFEIPKPEPIITLPDPKLDVIRKHYQHLAPIDQKDFLGSLNEDMIRFYYTEPDIFLHDKQIIPDNLDWSFYLLQAGRGLGKELNLDTQVPTPNGWKTIGSLQVGDQLFDENGEICQVIQLHPIHTDNISYRLTFDDDTQVECCKDHLWFTWDKAARKAAQRSANPQIIPKVRSTQEIVDTLHTKTSKIETNHSIPCAQPVKYRQQNLPIDPYTLGAWLGDGSTNSGAIESMDIQIIQQIPYDSHLVPSSADNKSKSFSYRIDGLTKLLKDNNLTFNKHIPIQYLQSSIEQRLALLQGLLDTDGCCLTSGMIEYCTVLPILAEQVCQLIRSLGIKANIRQNKSFLYGKRCKDRYRITIITEMPVFRLPRKLANIRHDKNQKTRTTHRYIVKAEPIQSVPMRCLTVDSPNNLFLITSSFIPTHNSLACSAFTAKQFRKGIKVAGMVGPTYNDVHRIMVPFIHRWFLPDEIEKYVKEEEIRFTNGGVLYLYSSDIEKKGMNLEFQWYDEIGAWCKGNPDTIKQRYQDLQRGVREGAHPRNVISSTPKKNHPFFLDFAQKIADNRPNYRLVKGSMFENPFLSDDYLLSVIEDCGSDINARQELFGDLLEDEAGAYWTQHQIDQNKEPTPSPLIYGAPRSRALTNDQLMGRTPIIKVDYSKPYLLRIVIGFDPSGSIEGDECGIIVAALYSNYQAYILEDCSGHYTPDQYSQLIADKYLQYQAAAVVVETNFGGKMTFEYVLRSKNANMKITSIHSKQGKTTRAEHISTLYAKNKVHHTKNFAKLEQQMCRFNVNYSKSPDRLDALGFALTELFFPLDATGNRISIANLPSY